MRYTTLKYALSVAIAVAALCSCSESAVELPFTDEGDAQTPSGLVEVRLEVPLQATRTERGNDDGKNLTAKWADGDSFGLFYVDDDGVVTGPIKFTHHPSGHDLQDNIFVGLMKASDKGTVMDTGSYNYYAVYPYQADSRVDDTSVVCTIPAIQSGIYDDGSDIMWASDMEKPALNPHFFNRLDLNFAHKTHALKITVPEDLNEFGNTIERISIEFPVPVAGKTVYPLTKGGSLDTPTPASHIVDVRFDDDNNPFENGKEFWVYTAARDISGSGEVKFTAYNDSEGMMSDYVSTGALNISEPHHITPVKLAVTKGFTVTWFDYIILDESSRLGEPLQTLNLTLPAGLQTADGTAEGGVAKLKKGADGSYQVAFRTEELADAIAAQSDSWDFQPKYESEHALLSPYSVDLSKFVIASGSYIPKEHNKFSIDAVPYLFEEDFSNLTQTFGHNDEFVNSTWDQDESSNTAATAYDLTVYNLKGWTGAKIGANKDSESLRIGVRVESSFLTNKINHGRADSAPITNIKEGKTPNVQVSFNYSINLQVTTSVSGGDNIVARFAYGYHDAQGLIKGTTGANPALQSPIESGITGSGGSYSNINEEKIYKITNCSNNHRLAWEVYADSPGSRVNANANGWVYIDNIKVSIAQ